MRVRCFVKAVETSDSEGTVRIVLQRERGLSERPKSKFAVILDIQDRIAAEFFNIGKQVEVSFEEWAE